MKKKVALIIGGTGGIGYSILKILTDKNIYCYATYLNNKKKADNIKETLENCLFTKCDITNEDEIIDLINQISSKHDHIDIVINTSTAKLNLKPFEKISNEEFLEDIKINLIGSIYLFKNVLSIMKKNKSGLLINFLSETIVDKPPARMSSYVAAKSGLNGLIKSLAVEYKQFNILFLSISPSFVETELLESFPEKLLEIERSKQPDNKFIQPDDIALLIQKIIEKPSNYSSGDNIILKNRQDLLRMLKDETNSN